MQNVKALLSVAFLCLAGAPVSAGDPPAAGQRPPELRVVGAGGSDVPPRSLRPAGASGSQDPAPGAASGGLADSPVLAKVKVVTTTEDLAALGREVGGEAVDVQSIARGYQDPHFVETKPSYLLKLKKANMFIQVGLELEVTWAPSLLISARNPKILPGNPGFVEASDGVEILQRTGGGADRSLGDVHPLGNPHYWLDPQNGRIIAKNIAERLALIDPEHAEAYRKNLAGFEAKLSAKEKEWDALAVAVKGIKVVTYHNSWPNFARRFGIQIVNFIEPKPGVPASPAHVHSLIQQI
ncbi:MAG: zinc ABC transporter substrate-binding protein, partial [Elusimicrobia bacterium]|nr:zinc ABC transporter substrate-binding protein [Elusimicrobiota bacterium]